jgi:hypothetical protein
VPHNSFNSWVKDKDHAAFPHLHIPVYFTLIKGAHRTRHSSATGQNTPVLIRPSLLVVVVQKEQGCRHSLDRGVAQD